MGRLFIVATPIGNLQDITLRALRVLGEVSMVAAEDTRTARILLNHHGIAAKTISYDDHNKARRIPDILSYLNDGDVALVTDAGTPAISDPGVDLAAAAREAGHEVIAIPGASAVIAALSIAGLPTIDFRFIGFLPRNAGDMRRFLEAQSKRPETLVAFESAQRLRRSLEVISALLPDRRIAVCRELTKIHEELFVGTAAEALAHFVEPRGEIVMIIKGAGAAEEKGDEIDEAALTDEVSEMKRLGLTQSQASALLSKRYGVNRRRLYELWLAADEA